MGKLVDNSSSHKRSAPFLTSSFKFLSDNYTVIIGLAGLSVYAIIRVAHDAFYSAFQLTPEAVGLSEVMILSRAALYCAVFFSALATIVACWTFLFASAVGTARRVAFWKASRSASPEQRLEDRVFRSHEALAALLLIGFVLPIAVDGLAPYFLSFFLFGGRRVFPPVLAWQLALFCCFFWAQTLAFFEPARRTRLKLTTCWIVISLPLIAAIFMLPPQTRHPFPELSHLRIHFLESFHNRFVHAFLSNRAGLSLPLATALGLWACILCVVLRWTWKSPRNTIRDASTTSKADPHLLRRTLTIAVVLSTFAAAFIMAGTAGQSYVGSVVDGSGYSPRHFGFLSIQAVPVCLSSSTPGVSGPYMFMGDLQGWMVLYQLEPSGNDEKTEFDRNRIIRIPSSAIAVEYLRTWKKGPDRPDTVNFAASRDACRAFQAQIKPLPGAGAKG